MKLKISIISLICLIAAVAGIVAHNARSDALNDEKNAGEQVVSFFRKDYQPLLEEAREEALGSKLILEVKGVLDIDSDQLDTFDETDRVYLEKVVDLLIRELYIQK